MRNPLAQELLPTDRVDKQTFRKGIVTSTSPVEVSLGGQTGLPANYAAGYTPVVDDVVIVLQTDTDLCIFDQIMDGG